MDYGSFVLGNFVHNGNIWAHGFGAGSEAIRNLASREKVFCALWLEKLAPT